MSEEPVYAPTDWRALVGKRVLIHGPHWSREIHERYIDEVSPGGIIKMRSPKTGATWWERPDYLQLIEVLP